jgi:hypothetical protein
VGLNHFAKRKSKLLKPRKGKKMKTSQIKMKKMLLLEYQYLDLLEYYSRLGRINFMVEPVKSVSEALEKLKNEKYDVYVFDLKILPGDAPKWQELDERKRQENPHFDSYLGLELLLFLDKARKNQDQLWKKIKFDFSKVIVLSLVIDKEVLDELESFGIPHQHIINKSSINLDTLPKLVTEIQNRRIKITQSRDHIV